MKIAKTKSGDLFKVENGKYYDIKTNQAVDINPIDVIEVVKVGFTVWQLIKQFIGLIKNLFKK
jgi:hypothetical protein